VRKFLETAVSADEAEYFTSLSDENPWDAMALRVGRLEGLIAMAEEPHGQEKPVLNEASPQAGSRKVFVVHGHDDAAIDGVARFIEKIKLEPIILHEMPNSGRTIIEKFETYSHDVAFAVVLLTPDDLAREASVGTAVPQLKPRARQNVIMELGYFIGRLGRTKVCALHKGNVELPSDYQGVLYVAMDSGGTWKAKLARELQQAKIPIDLEGLLG
jgi:predicted nucleotide-binding protein